jgi:hypothetical protein
LQHFVLPEILRETAKLVRVHHLRWVVKHDVFDVLTLRPTATRRPTVFDCLNRMSLKINIMRPSPKMRPASIRKRGLDSLLKPTGTIGPRERQRP